MKLFAVLLGGSGGPGRFSEDHDTVFVVADDERSAKKAAKAKWAGYGRAHVDALSFVDHVDGFDISVVPGGTVPEGEFISYNDVPYDEED